MLDQALLPERIFGLAVVDGRRTVRPGAVVRFRFRARNASEIATPPARLTFALPAGWSALDALTAEIPPVRPGGEHIVWFAARPDLADETTALSRFQAVLHVDEMVLGSNVVAVRVTGSPRFRTPASAIRIEPSAGGNLRVSVDVVNEGDAAARNVRIVAPPPPGFRADNATTVAHAFELRPGAAFTYSYEMEPLAPASPIVRIDDAYVTFDGGRVALMTGATHLLAPNVQPPHVVSVRAATRLDSTITIDNDGWVPARDVRLVVELPAGWRILRGTMLADGAPAAIRRDPGAENGVTLALPLVPARGSVAVTVVSSAFRPRTDGTIVVRCGAHAVESAIPEPTGRSLRLDARPETPFAIPGATVPVAVDALNNGETTETVTVAVDGVPCWQGELKPGATAGFVTRYATAADLTDGEVATLNVSALGTDGEPLAATTIELRVVDRPWIAVDEVVVDGGEARVMVRNVGATTARDLRLDGDFAVRIEELEPGEIKAIALPSAKTRNAAVVGADGSSVPIAWDVQPEPVTVDAELIVADAIRAGQRLDIRLQCVSPGLLESLRVRPRPHAGAVYVAGSTAVNGYAIVDGVDGPPLLLGEGLALYDIPAGTIADISWSLLPRTPGDLTVAVDLEANGVKIELAEAHVRIGDATPFGARPSSLPFHIDAATVADPSGGAGLSLAQPATIPPGNDIAMLHTAAFDALPHAERRLTDTTPSAQLPPGGGARGEGPEVLGGSPGPSGPVALAEPPSLAIAPPATPVAPAISPVASTAGTFVLQLALDPVRLAAIRRVLRGSRGPGVVGHLPSIAVLLPSGIGADPTVSAALGTATDSVRGVYERLFVKLRIPGYDVTPFDLEDNAARRDLLHFFRVAAAGHALPPIQSSDLRVTLAAPDLDAMRSALVDAPLGGPAPLAAIASLLPRGGSGGLAPLGAYVEQLAAELLEMRGLSHDAFTSFVTMHRSPTLDDARDGAIAALDSPGIFASG